MGTVEEGAWNAFNEDSDWQSGRSRIGLDGPEGWTDCGPLVSSLWTVQGRWTERPDHWEHWPLPCFVTALRSDTIRYDISRRCSWRGRGLYCLFVSLVVARGTLGN